MKKFLKISGISVGVLLVLLIAHYFIIKHLDKEVFAGSESLVDEKLTAGSPKRLPSYFVDGERFYIKIPIGGEDTLLGFGDTGGGISMILPDSKNKGSLPSKVKTGILKGVMPIEYILFNDMVLDSSFPKPFPLRSFVLRNPFKRITSPHLIIPPMEDELKFMTKVQPEMEAFLGQAFFMNKSWTFDYPNKEIWVNTPIDETQRISPSVQTVGFKKDENNVHLYGHPRIRVEIDGDSLDVLFDTGATIVPSEDGKKQMKTNKKTLGGSFIAISVFQKWRKNHPEWTFYPKADLAGDVIEVPLVKIGDHQVGPVLFATRPDENWSEGMIVSMDKIVKGAIGGSALKYFKVMIDYNSELIRFEKPMAKQD